MGQLMMDHRFIIHVTHEKKFENNGNFYQFVDDERSSGMQVEVSFSS